ncbi:MAG: AMIN domain-containing protein [bacterium]|nr:AMIN domain-containing protein [bacterium]
MQEKLKAPFQLSSYKVLIDGKTVLEKRIGEAGLSGITINGLPEGKYKINVSALYSGSGYGVFEYHEDYKYPLESETEVSVEEGKVTSLKIICNDKDGFLADLDKRPYITYHQSRIDSPGFLDGKAPESDLDEAATDKEKRSDLVDLPGKEGKIRSTEMVLPEDAGKAKFLTGLNVEKDSGFKLVVMADGVINDYLTKKLDKPDRIVIDIKGVIEQLKTDTLQVNDELVRKVRVGQHPGYTRIVLDTPGKPMLDYDIKPTDSGLIINVSEDGDDVRNSDNEFKGLNKARHLTGISVERMARGVKVFLGGDGFFGDYTSRLMDKPDRLVIDIKGVKELLDLDELPVNSILLKTVRVGQHPGMLRLVLDLSSAAEVKFDVKSLSDGLLVEILEN